MKAAILQKTGQPPVVGEFDEPDRDVVTVRPAGCNPGDLALASGAMGEPLIPSIIGKEGVGDTADGPRGYFDSPAAPFGPWALRCQVDPARTFPVPDPPSDELAVTLGIAGPAAWLPLTRHTHVEPRGRRQRRHSVPNTDGPHPHRTSQRHDARRGAACRYQELAAHAVDGRITSESGATASTRRGGLARTGRGPHVKIVVKP